MNRLIIAAAGSGKTTYLIDQALSVRPTENILITSYTENNTNAIKQKIIKRIGYVPPNIYIKTWFSFLLTDLFRPFQDVLDNRLFDKEIGFLLVNSQSTPYISKKNVMQYYFHHDKIFSDKISAYIYECNRKVEGLVIKRLSRCYGYIFFDEVQDLAGYDLDIVSLMAKSNINLLLVGDPRQVVYLTNHSKRNEKYQNGGISNYIKENFNEDNFEINDTQLNVSHRNPKVIISYSLQLFPVLPKCEACFCSICHNPVEKHVGMFYINKKDVKNYVTLFNPVILRWSKKSEIPVNTRVMNMGVSKGLTFDHVLIIPTPKIVAWIKDHSYDLEFSIRCKFYVAITRARYSCAVILDNTITTDFPDLVRFKFGP